MKKVYDMNVDELQFYIDKWKKDVAKIYSSKKPNLAKAKIIEDRIEKYWRYKVYRNKTISYPCTEF